MPACIILVLLRAQLKAPALIEDALQLVNEMEELQQLHRGKISGQAQYGSLSSVCRGATNLLAKSWKTLASHPLAGAFHTAALTENVCETFFSAVTLNLGSGTMVSATPLEWGKAVAQAEINWVC